MTMPKRSVLACTVIAAILIISASSAQGRSLGSGNTILINKSYSLRSIDYIPPLLVVPRVLLAEPARSQETLLVPTPAKNLERLFKAACDDDISLVLTSGYRPYEDQAVLYKYGFTVRYPLYKTASTGYEYEPWHLRYVGSSLATQLHQHRETLEEFYGRP